MKAMTMCPICHKTLTNEQLLYSHHCSKCDTEERKYPKRIEEQAPEPPPLTRQTHVVRDPYEYQQPQLTYRDMLQMRQHEMRQLRHARQVHPVRSHYGL